MNQVVIHDFQRDFPVEITQGEVQQEIIKEYLKRRNLPAKIIYQIPAKFLTNRMMAFPIKNKRLVQKAIPFQIEKDLLYGPKEYHYEAQILPQFPNQKDNYALASIIDIQKFTDFIKNMAQNHTTPDVLTSEISLFQCYVSRFNKDGSIAILDIGHETTKSYFFFHTKMVASHLSYVAGNAIDEIISETYMIPLEEAISYKHQKAFFVTKKQALALAEDQRVFGTMMGNLFAPLIEDFKKWELGHRIKTGKKLEKIYITGGCAAIKNIDNFISIELGIPVEIFDVLNPLCISQASFSLNEKIPFTLSHLMADSLVSKITPLNFLTKAFAPKNSSAFPIHSISFLAARVGIVTIIAMIGLFIDQGLLLYRESTIDKKSLSVLKKNELNLINREIMMFRVNPRSIFEKLKRTQNTLKTTAKIYEDFFQRSSIEILMDINEKLTLNSNIDLIQLENSQGKVFAHFKAKTKEALDDLQHQISKIEFKDNKIQVYEKNLTLNWEFLE